MSKKIYSEPGVYFNHASKAMWPYPPVDLSAEDLRIVDVYHGHRCNYLLSDSADVEDCNCSPVWVRRPYQQIKAKRETFELRFDEKTEDSIIDATDKICHSLVSKRCTLTEWWEKYIKTGLVLGELLQPLYERLEFLQRCGVTVESEETADGERFFIRNVSAKTRTYLEQT